MTISRAAVGAACALAAGVASAEETPYAGRACQAGPNVELRKALESGAIPELKDWLWGEWDRWSSSMLKPPGKPPDATKAVVDEWSCHYSAYHLIDEKTDTAWCEGAKGDGVGEVVVARVNTRDELQVWSGFGKSQKLWEANGRPSKIRIHYLKAAEGDVTPGRNGITFANLKRVKTWEHTLKDRNAWQPFPIVKQEDLKASDETFVAIELLAVTKGKKYPDTCISEIRNTPR